MLSNTDFSRSLAGWDVKGEGASINCSEAGLCIRHDASSKYTELAQCFKTQTLPARVILQAWVRTEQVIPGPKSWNTAKVGFVGYDAEGRGLYQYSTQLVGLSGSLDWQHYRKNYVVQQNALQYCVKIALYTSPGIFYVRNISLHSAIRQPMVEYGRQILLFVWLALSAWALLPVMKKYRWTARGYLLLLLVFFIIAGVLLPIDIKQYLELEIQRILDAMGLPMRIHSESGMRADPLAFWPGQWDTNKLGHLFSFGLLSTVLFSERESRLHHILPGLLLLAVCSETLQVFAIGRTPRLADFNVDLAGIMLGWLVGRSIHRLGSG